jgi:hypothetical protein
MTVLDIKSGAPESWHTLQLALYTHGEPMPQVRFEEEGHRYFLGDRELVSVSKVLNPEPNPFYKPGSADRGHKVHRMCVMDAQAVLDYESVDEQLRGYLMAWRQFCRDLVGDFNSLEEIVGDERLGYAGRRDVTLTLRGTTTPGIVLYLKRNGKYDLNPVGHMEMQQLIVEACKKVVFYHRARRLQMWPR